MRLIDGDALIEKFNEKTDLAECLVDARAAKRFATFCALADAVEEMPTVDAAPVVHSYWEEYTCPQYVGTDEYGEPKWRDGRLYVCHDCRRKTVVKSNYCPNCGAKMDGGTESG